MSEFLSTPPPSPVPPPGQDRVSRYRFTADNEKFPYLDYLVEVAYLVDEGIRELPVAGAPDEPCDVVRLHSPIGSKVVRFYARRQGAKPEVPDPTSQDANEVLKNREIVPLAPKLTGDGITWEHTIQGQYTYILRRPPGAKTNYHVPNVPYATCTAHEHNFPATAFKKDLA